MNQLIDWLNGKPIEIDGMVYIYPGGREWALPGIKAEKPWVSPAFLVGRIGEKRAGYRLLAEEAE